jgi:hypothetical protein
MSSRSGIPDHGFAATSVPASVETYDQYVAAYDASPEDSPLQALMQTSPDVHVHTSAAAQTAFLLGLAAALSAPFSLTMFLATAGGAAGVVFGIAGVVLTSRRGVAGGVLALVGLISGLCAVVLVGLRYLGLDTAFGDAWVAQLRDLLRWSNDLLPAP